MMVMMMVMIVMMVMMVMMAVTGDADGSDRGNDTCFADLTVLPSDYAAQRFVFLTTCSARECRRLVMRRESLTVWRTVGEDQCLWQDGDLTLGPHVLVTAAAPG